LFELVRLEHPPDRHLRSEVLRHRRQAYQARSLAELLDVRELLLSLDDWPYPEQSGG